MKKILISAFALALSTSVFAAEPATAPATKQAPAGQVGTSLTETTGLVGGVSTATAVGIGVAVAAGVAAAASGGGGGGGSNGGTTGTTGTTGPTGTTR